MLQKRTPTGKVKVNTIIHANAPEVSPSAVLSGMLESIGVALLSYPGNGAYSICSTEDSPLVRDWQFRLVDFALILDMVVQSIGYAWL